MFQYLLSAHARYKASATSGRRHPAPCPTPAPRGPRSSRAAPRRGVARGGRPEPRRNRAQSQDSRRICIPGRSCRPACAAGCARRAQRVSSRLPPPEPRRPPAPPAPHSAPTSPNPQKDVYYLALPQHPAVRPFPSPPPEGEYPVGGRGW